MTIQEAKQQVEDCERKVANAYNNMYCAARKVGTSAVSVAERNTTICTLVPFVIISVIGLLLFAAHPIFFVGVICVGVWVSKSSYSNAKSVQDQIENQQKILNSTLHNNPIV